MIQKVSHASSADAVSRLILQVTMADASPGRMKAEGQLGDVSAILNKLKVLHRGAQQALWSHLCVVSRMRWPTSKMKLSAKELDSTFLSRSS